MGPSEIFLTCMLDFDHVMYMNIQIQFYLEAFFNYFKIYLSYKIKSIDLDKWVHNRIQNIITFEIYHNQLYKSMFIIEYLFTG